MNPIRHVLDGGFVRLGSCGELHEIFRAKLDAKKLGRLVDLAMLVAGDEAPLSPALNGRRVFVPERLLGRGQAAEFLDDAFRRFCHIRRNTPFAYDCQRRKRR